MTSATAKIDRLVDDLETLHMMAVDLLRAFKSDDSSSAPDTDIFRYSGNAHPRVIFRLRKSLSSVHEGETCSYGAHGLVAYRYNPPPKGLRLQPTGYGVSRIMGGNPNLPWPAPYRVIDAQTRTVKPKWKWYDRDVKWALNELRKEGAIDDHDRALADRIVSYEEICRRIGEEPIKVDGEKEDA